MDEIERVESVKHCRWVDEVFPNAPWVITQEFLDQHNIDYVAHGEDLSLDADGNDVYQFVKDQGRFRTIKRTDGISTSDLILRIIKNYDAYVRRNLARGYDRKELNVSLIKAQRIQMEHRIDKFKDEIQERVRKLQDRVKTIDLQSWKRVKSFFFTDFLSHFNPDSDVDEDHTSVFSDNEDDLDLSSSGSSLILSPPSPDPEDV